MIVINIKSKIKFKWNYNFFFFFPLLFFAQIVKYILFLFLSLQIHEQMAYKI